jgi:hypothetical protein
MRLPRCAAPLRIVVELLSRAEEARRRDRGAAKANAVLNKPPVAKRTSARKKIAAAKLPGSKK